MWTGPSRVQVDFDLMSALGYNERSWAIDLIVEINRVVGSSPTRRIHRAGGEHSLRGDGTCLFPDVVLYGDPGASMILQGWELKMPDTSLEDNAFIQNARIKADALGLDHFLLWNAREAVLYRKHSDGVFQTFYRWGPVRAISTREDVRRCEEQWKALLILILEDLNRFFCRRRGRRPALH